MPMLRRPLTPEEVQMIAGDKYTLLPGRWDHLFGPLYQRVRYRAALNHIDYERRDTFYCLGPKSPSDCIWMVPDGIGALEA